MNSPTLHRPGPIDAVLFDFHSTLVDQGNGAEWLRLGRELAGRPTEPGDEALAARLDFLWERSRELDPDSTRDLDAVSHRRVFETLIDEAADLDHDQTEALYQTLLATWTPYDDTRPTLEALQERGVRTAVVSNIGIDIRPLLERTGLSGLLDAVVLSCEVGAVKPRAEIFLAALAAVDAGPAETLMVGDAWTDDGGAAALGIRTLILPRTTGPVHGLHLVTAVVDAAG